MWGWSREGLGARGNLALKTPIAFPARAKAIPFPLCASPLRFLLSPVPLTPSPRVSPLCPSPLRLPLPPPPPARRRRSCPSGTPVQRSTYGCLLPSSFAPHPCTSPFYPPAPMPLHHLAEEGAVQVEPDSGGAPAAAPSPGPLRWPSGHEPGGVCGAPHRKGAAA